MSVSKNRIFPRLKTWVQRIRGSRHFSAGVGFACDWRALIHGLN
jgi:hypothetical protein